MAIKMIAMDIDGTLLTTDHCLTECNRSALERCVNSGIALVVATGRPSTTIPKIVRDIPGIKYLISANGAKIHDATGKIFSEKYLSPLAIRKVWPLLEDELIMCEVYWKGIPYVSTVCNNALHRYGIPDSFEKHTINTRMPVDNLPAFTESHIGEIEAINFNYATKKIQKRIFDLLSEGGDYALSSSLPFNYTIGVTGVSKYVAIKQICETMKIEMSSVMAFGDGDNDLDMIRFSGIGVAMANASSSLKEAADFVTLDCENSGIAYAIEKLI